MIRPHFRMIWLKKNGHQIRGGVALESSYPPPCHQQVKYTVVGAGVKLRYQPPTTRGASKKGEARGVRHTHLLQRAKLWCLRSNAVIVSQIMGGGQFLQHFIFHSLKKLGRSSPQLGHFKGIKKYRFPREKSWSKQRYGPCLCLLCPCPSGSLRWHPQTSSARPWAREGGAGVFCNNSYNLGRGNSMQRLRRLRMGGKTRKPMCIPISNQIK